MVDRVRQDVLDLVEKNGRVLPHEGKLMAVELKELRILFNKGEELPEVDMENPQLWFWSPGKRAALAEAFHALGRVGFAETTVGVSFWQEVRKQLEIEYMRRNP